MSNTDQFWQYAKEAMLSASYARTGDERKCQLDLARIWTQAALLDRQHTLVHYVNPKSCTVLTGCSLARSRMSSPVLTWRC